MRFDDASTANEAVRSLCHATIVFDPDATVGDVYWATADLSSLGHRLAQAAEQLAALLEHRLSVGSLVADDGRDPLDAITAATEGLRLAAASAVVLGERMAAAQNAIAMIADPT
jgi:hypothetical protein